MANLSESISVPIAAVNQRFELLRAVGAVKDELFAGPQSIYLDIEQRCNLNCIYCRSHSLLRSSRPSIYARLSSFDLKRIVQAAKKWHCREMIITGHGEPTLNPNFLKFLQWILDTRIPVILYTNGTFPYSFLRILRKVNRVVINFSAPTPESFANLVSRDNARLFYRIRRNIRSLAQLKKGPFLELSFIVTRNNHYLFNSVLQFARQEGVKRVIFSHMMPTAATREISLRRIDLSALNKSIASCQPGAVEHNLAEIADLPVRPGHKHDIECFTGWYNLVFSGDGTATICCRHEAPAIGSLKTDSPELIWASQKAQKTRLCYKYKLDIDKPHFRDTCSCCRWVGFFASRISGLQDLLEKTK